MAKEFSWSFSRLKNYDTCPKRYVEIDVNKNYSEKEEPDGPLAWGNRVHDAMAKAVTGAVPLPPDMDGYQKWCDRVQAGPGTLLVEQKYAITRSLSKTQYFASNVWYRGIGDVVRIAGPVALVLDWKTGAFKANSLETYGPQLILMAQCIFSHYPSVQRVRSEFVWLQDDCSTPEVFTRDDLAEHWVELYNRVAKLEEAHRKQDFPPKPSGLCKKYCPVVSCPYHGKGAR